MKKIFHVSREKFLENFQDLLIHEPRKLLATKAIRASLRKKTWKICIITYKDSFNQNILLCPGSFHNKFCGSTRGFWKFPFCLQTLWNAKYIHSSEGWKYESYRKEKSITGERRQIVRGETQAINSSHNSFLFILCASVLRIIFSNTNYVIRAKDVRCLNQTKINSNSNIY